MIRYFLIALQFLTRLPVTLRSSPSKKEMGYSILFYPLIGLLLGIVLLVVSRLLVDVQSFLTAALLLLIWVGLTGALHLDGLADMSDAWVGGLGEQSRTLRIMKDPNCGPMGVTAIILVLLVKCAALSSIIEIGNYYLLILAPLLGRVALPLLFLTTPYVRAGGLGETLASELPKRLTTGWVITTYLSIVLLIGMKGFGIVLIALLLFILLRIIICQRIGGTTGDTAGALVELTETATLVGIVMLWVTAE